MARDHAWCVATEIDLDSTYVGGSEACIEELLANSELEVARLDVAADVTAVQRHPQPRRRTAPAEIAAPALRYSIATGQGRRRMRT